MPLKARDKNSEGRGEEVRRYFDGTAAARFDVIYQDEKRLFQKLVDRLFRDVVHRRFQLTFELCREIEGSRVLDIGCGSGRYAVEFARRGAEVVGLDFSSTMVEMARRAAEAAGVADRCRFEVGNFRDWCEPHHFDICLAIGFFDYVEDPGNLPEEDPQNCAWTGRIFLPHPLDIAIVDAVDAPEPEWLSGFLL